MKQLCLLLLLLSFSNQSPAQECKDDQNVAIVKNMVAQLKRGPAQATKDDFSKELALSHPDFFKLGLVGIGSCFIMKSNGEMYVRNPLGPISGRLSTIPLNNRMLAKEFKKLVAEGKCDTGLLTDSFQKHRKLVQQKDRALATQGAQGIGHCQIHVKKDPTDEHWYGDEYLLTTPRFNSKSDDEAYILDQLRLAILRGECDV